MKITRYAYESITRIYEFDIDDNYIKEMNIQLDMFMQGRPHPIITKEHIMSLLKGDEMPEFDDVLISRTELWEDTLTDWLWEYIDTDVWDSDSYIADEETHDFSDDITLSAEEEKQYKEYRKTIDERTNNWDDDIGSDFQQLSIFDTN